MHDCTAAVADGALRIECGGNDPYLFGPSMRASGPVVVQIRMRCAAGGSAQIFWSPVDAPGFDEGRSQHFHLIHDGQWHDYTVPLNTSERIQQLRLDPLEAAGVVDVASIHVVKQTLHPLEIVSVRTDGTQITARVANHSIERVLMTLDGFPYKLDPGSTTELTENSAAASPFLLRDVVVRSQGTPDIHRSIEIVNTNAKVSWSTVEAGKLRVRAAQDGSGARIELDGKLVALLAPLVSVDGWSPKMDIASRKGGLQWNGEGIMLRLSAANNQIYVTIESSLPCEGPVLRALGPLDQGIFAGLEYLGPGEHSSSTLDIETDEHVRYAPDPMKVTMPLMSFVTDRASTAMTWDDMTLQPVYATPNFLDGPDASRASLRGKRIDCRILVRPPGPIENTILWAFRQHDLPPLPATPRTRDEELALCLTTLNGPPLRTEAGWGHCIEPSWGRAPFADEASTLWRLSGQAPSLPNIVPGGGHIVNDSIYFVTGRAQEWLEMRTAHAKSIIANQKPDGSFRYEGKLARGHYEDTASGFCALQAAELLDHARLTGDTEALKAGIKALEYMKHFRDPRGAQTWEVPLHTPDIMASAHLVHAYVRGYQLTGKPEYLERARGWAISGLPFVYQWGNQPVMPYATIAVFGATGWRAPNWMGLPVQWCGYVYAYALTMLAPYDKSADWPKIATGILLTAEQEQYPSGPFAGCLPDSFNLGSQQRNEPAINPSALVSLRFALEGKLDSLAVAAGGGRGVTAPFPVAIRDGKAEIDGRDGVAYQILIDGKRVVNVASHGRDVIPLDAK